MHNRLVVSSLSLLVLALCLACPSAGSAAATPQTSAVDLSDVIDEVRERIRTRVETQRRGLGALQITTADRTVAQFYESRGFQPAWIDDDGPTLAARSLARALNRASQHGLRPDDYHASALDTLLRTVSSASSDLDARTVTDFDLLCTDAFLLYGAHLLRGRVRPETITSSWNLEARRADVLDALDEALAHNRIAASLGDLAPSQPEYRSLRRALRYYRSISQSGGWPSVPDGAKLEPGATDARVPLLRERLRVEEAVLYPDSARALAAPEGPRPQRDDSSPAADSVYDASLKAAVVRFQERNGLDADGVVGPATLRALNVTARDRTRQIEANLERWRWLPDDLGERHILVNVAAYHLRIVDGGRDTLSMRIVAGKPARQTPVFTGRMSYLVFNPYWHVPHSLATQDKLPDIQKDVSYLARQNIEVFKGWGADAAPVDPSTIEWSTLSRTNFPYRLRQKPGPNNALGRVKFMFPNPHSVYLHDTPTRNLFGRAERSFSSGCIRVERPLDLAVYLLGDQPGWTREKIESTITGPVTADLSERTVLLKQPLPVHLLYWTAWADGKVVHFRSDVYDRDAPLLDALSSSAPSPK